MSHLDRVRLRANAKVNLHLRVLDRRPDGYHNIETIFHSISLSDTLEMSRRDEGFTISCTSPDVPADDSNLAVIAARRLLGEGRGGVHIHLAKSIPVAAGLGGGSADAAASLVGVNLLYGLGLSDACLMEAAAGVGSDVPFMLKGGCAAGEGRGEILTPLKPLPLVVALSRVPSADPLTTMPNEALSAARARRSNTRLSPSIRKPSAPPSVALQRPASPPDESVQKKP